MNREKKKNEIKILEDTCKRKKEEGGDRLIMRDASNHIFHLQRYNSFRIARFPAWMRIGRAGGIFSSIGIVVMRLVICLDNSANRVRSLFDARPATITIANVEALMATWRTCRSSNGKAHLARAIVQNRRPWFLEPHRHRLRPSSSWKISHHRTLPLNYQWNWNCFIPIIEYDHSIFIKYSLNYSLNFTNLVS